MAKKRGDRIYVAKESFTIEVDGATQAIHAGRTRVREGHPIMAGREQFFEELTVDYELEQATDAPGEKRGAAKKK